ncbi:hypothetical protein H8356DRAFT_926880 [Neocallimastix lanati (nom. inval.)]|jgi:hypothetical protein|uniref:Uncharacterized protein n=1 Tax=Neocallimastix californiae TaxID=1754190 RepID=A0A1Y2AUM5_9FUNG|nr:hypothetical protein H8356DRAFT_926880 [Neocallimastix sp. JGI-2020a]ORY26298.1 hypothetical protein LY90DRAFT_674609 [Neocallimastix californiae]|eukprot:ORY26298.1 hypothetical protein LY90DRAFT_674609 [Neocallimastix californiae]
MAFGRKSDKPYTTTTTTTKTTINGESATKYKLRRKFWILSILLFIPTIILLILAAAAGKHNIWPFNRVWAVEGQVNMDRQASVLNVSNKLSNLVGDVLPAGFPNLGIPIEKILLSQNAMKLFASRDQQVLSDAGVPQNQWDNVQDMFVKFNKDDSYNIYPTKDSQGVDIGTFKNNILNYRVAGHRISSYFSSFKWMFHINWIICLIIALLIIFAQLKFRDNNIRMFCIIYLVVLLLIFMVFFFNLVMYIVLNFGVNGITSFLNRITIGAIPNAVSELLGNRTADLNQQMFFAKASSLRKILLAVLILLFLIFLLVLLEVIYMFLSLPTRLPKRETKTTTTVRTVKKNPNNNNNYEIDIADREY